MCSVIRLFALLLIRCLFPLSAARIPARFIAGTPFEKQTLHSSTFAKGQQMQWTPRGAHLLVGEISDRIFAVLQRGAKSAA
jgi:hypothetical protein